MSLRIRTISRLTGVREATLRAWEKRHGFPVPSRAGNNYRTYSREQVEQIRRVAALIQEGYAVSEAISQVRAVPTTSLPDKARLQEQFWSAVMTLDAEAAEAVLEEASLVFPPDAYCDDFLMPMLRTMTTRLDVAREHLASALIRQRLRQLLRAVPTPGTGPRLVLACPPRDTHEGGLLALAYHLKRRGFVPLVLGADTPVDALVEAVKAADASAVALSFVRTREPGELEQVLTEVVRATPVPVIAGGPAAREQEGPITRTGARYADSPEALLELLGPPAPAPPRRGPPSPGGPQ